MRTENLNRNYNKKNELKGIKSLLKLTNMVAVSLRSRKKTYIYIEGIFTSNEVAMWFGQYLCLCIENKYSKFY